MGRNLPPLPHFTFAARPGKRLRRGTSRLYGTFLGVLKEVCDALFQYYYPVIYPSLLRLLGQ